MRRTSCLAGIFTTFALLLPAAVAGQPSPRRAFVEATNASGGAVLDLKPSDFRVTENGEPREVSSAALVQRPTRVVLIVDATDAIRQPIGQIRKALSTFLEAIDPQHEMMLVTVAGTPQVRVRPTLERQQLVKSVENIFGTTGSNSMHRTVDDIFHRFGQTTDSRPIFVVVTTEGFESTNQINPQEIKHIAEHFIVRGGTLHAVKLIVPLAAQAVRSGQLTDLPVSLMISRDAGGGYTNTSPNGLADVLQRVADVINDAHERAPRNYQVEYGSALVKGRKPSAPEVRVSREGVRLSVVAAP
jgi:hypothetical protein